MNKKLEQVQKEALALCAPVFHEMEEISLYNTEKVLSAFRKHHLSAYHFAPSNGYGYGDPGREKLEITDKKRQCTLGAIEQKLCGRVHKIVQKQKKIKLCC